ncbi:MAG TPA: GNAT family N-acetyltransferase [Burkholderiales bacterium]|nr:GNAT family N-acetyltransferase [Burkholderiales bacterium]
MIRPMQPADKQPVMALIRATGMFTPAEIDVAEELIDIYLGVPEQPDYRIVVIENERKDVAGYLTWGPTPMAEDAYDLYWMAVSPAEQGTGLGKALVRWLEGEVRKLNGRMIIIETSSQPLYHPSRQFYVNLDYKEVARIPDYYKKGDDRVIYAKSFR